MRISFQLRRLAAASAALLLGAALAAPALAQSDQQQQFGPRIKTLQQGQPQVPPPQTLATFGAWQVQCQDEPVPKAADGSQPPPIKQCGMFQEGTNDKNPQAKMSLVVMKDKQGDKPSLVMRILAPIGVYLPTGVAMEIDGDARGRVMFARCFPQVCMAWGAVTPETLAKMKKGKEASFIIYEAPGISLPMKFLLPGFDKALASLDKM